MPGLLLRVDAVNLFLFGHLHIGLMALSEVVYLNKHTHTIQINESSFPCINLMGNCLRQWLIATTHAKLCAIVRYINLEKHFFL